jgi:5'-3' exonuclease
MNDKEIIEKIKTATGKQIFSFICRLKKNLAGLTRSKMSKYEKLCFERAMELNQNKYANWEQAKSILENMGEPPHTQTTDLEPINGYPCKYVKSKKTNLLVICNPKTSIAYIKDFGSGEDLYEFTKNTFAT